MLMLASISRQTLYAGNKKRIFEYIRTKDTALYVANNSPGSGKLWVVAVIIKDLW